MNSYNVVLDIGYLKSTLYSYSSIGLGIYESGAKYNIIDYIETLSLEDKVNKTTEYLANANEFWFCLWQPIDKKTEKQIEERLIDLRIAMGVINYRKLFQGHKIEFSVIVIGGDENIIHKVSTLFPLSYRSSVNWDNNDRGDSLNRLQQNVAANKRNNKTDLNPPPPPQAMKKEWSLSSIYYSLGICAFLIGFLSWVIIEIKTIYPLLPKTVPLWSLLLISILLLIHALIVKRKK